MPPPKKKPPTQEKEFDPENGLQAIHTVKEALPLIIPGPPLLHRTPHGITVEIPLIYQGLAIDKIHYNPLLSAPMPKGMPAHLPPDIRLNEEDLASEAKRLAGELEVVNAVEYREPEDSWIVFLRWKHLVVAHVKVDYKGTEILPDYHLTAELRKRVI